MSFARYKIDPKIILTMPRGKTAARRWKIVDTVLKAARRVASWFQPFRLDQPQKPKAVVLEFSARRWARPRAAEIGPQGQRIIGSSE
jgi:hypothetical protein